MTISANQLINALQTAKTRKPYRKRDIYVMSGDGFVLDIVDAWVDGDDDLILTIDLCLEQRTGDP